MAFLTCDYYSLARKGFISLTVILPMDPLPAGPYPVQYNGGPWPAIYLLHGYSGNRNDWLLRSRIEEWAQKRGYAVVMPDGANRFYIDNEDTGEQYGAFVGEELVEVTRRLFPLSGKRDSTVIAGMSMGGFGAIRNGLKYADTFGSIIALSSALITDEVAEMQPGSGNGIAPYSYYRHVFGQINQLPGSDKDPKHLAKALMEGSGTRPRLFMACGSEDFLYAQNCDYHDYLNRIGYAHEWWVRPGVHDFDFWNQSMLAAMDWLALPK